MRTLTFFLFFAWASTSLLGQLPKLTDQAKICVITCAGDPEVLYYSFGHTAFRVEDPKLGIDVIYNYGTFDFDQPNFYLNFTKGRLRYTLTRRRFENFLPEYAYEKRWVREQVLQLTPEETNQLFQFFEWNYRPENRDYLYDPLFDNCSTMVGKILVDQFGGDIKFGDDHLKELSTFRQLVRSHLHTNSWGAFGIDLAFGAVVDRKATVQEHTFLPYQAMEQIRVAQKNGKPLLAKEAIVLDYEEKTAKPSFFTSPLFVFLLLALLVFWFTYRDLKKGHRNRRLDFWLFLISGLAGTFLFLLWFGTDHVYTKNNGNILWLFPLNLFVAFFVLRKEPPAWVKKYLWSLLMLMVLSLLLWIIKAQLFSPINILIIIPLAIRYVFLLIQPKLQDA